MTKSESEVRKEERKSHAHVCNGQLAAPKGKQRKPRLGKLADPCVFISTTYRKQTGTFW